MLFSFFGSLASRWPPSTPTCVYSICIYIYIAQQQFIRFSLISVALSLHLIKLTFKHGQESMTISNVTTVSPLFFLIYGMNDFERSNCRLTLSDLNSNWQIAFLYFYPFLVLVLFFSLSEFQMPRLGRGLVFSGSRKTRNESEKKKMSDQLSLGRMSSREGKGGQKILTQDNVRWLSA